MSEPNWELLERYLADDCNPVERALIEQWLQEVPSRRAIVEELRLRVIEEQPAPLVVGWGREEVRARLEREIVESEKPLPSTSGRPRPVRAAAPFAALAGRRGWPRTLKAAAAAVLVVAGGTVSWRLYSHRAPPAPAAEPAFHLVSAPRGQRLGLRLADGTAVTLAPGSSLRIPGVYGNSARDVSLEGEAMFTVTHDATRPFAVHTARAVIRDLGTEFVVRAYAEDGAATDVVVSQGLVVVARSPAAMQGAFDSLTISRGERARLSDDGNLTLTRGVSLDRYFAWTEGRLVFRDTPLREVVAQLERWHDVDISLSQSSLGDRPLTASFKGESLAETLRATAAALSLDVVKRGSGYVLRAR